MLLSMGKPFGITLYDESEAKLREICSRRKMSMRGLMSQLVEWFATLDDTLHALVLDQLADEDRDELLARALERRRTRRSDEADANAEFVTTGKLRKKASQKPRGEQTTRRGA